MMWWGWLLIALAAVGSLALVAVTVVLAFVLRWWIWRRHQDRAAEMVEAESVAPGQEPVVKPIPLPTREEEALPLDDLKRIEGIGPKISTVLQEAGIRTFAQLAEIDMSRLEQIIKEGGIRIAYPRTWPEQARLAAAGEWAELEALQGDLKGGRRT